MSAPAAESGPIGIVGCYRALWKALERVPIALPVLVMRIGVALVFWRSGQAKLPFGNDAVLTLFREEYKLPLLPPELAASLATTTELSCPVLLVIGFLARPAAAILLAQTLIIQLFIYPTNTCLLARLGD